MLRESSRTADKKKLSIVGALLLCVVLAAMQYAGPLHASEESLSASTTVTSSAAGSFGARVVGSHRVVLPQHALDEPDSRGAWVLHRGWISLELEDMVIDCSRVCLWVRKTGWGFPRFDVYVSADGAAWTHVGSGTCRSRSYEQHDFNGAFGNVKYVKVERKGSGRWAALLLDAVWVKGGDADEVAEKEGIPD